MKYIKTIEELNVSTYRSAHHKLVKLGQYKRAKKLDQWANDTETREIFSVWEKMVRTYSKWGKFAMDWKWDDEISSGDYYIAMNFPIGHFMKSIENVEHGDDIGYMYLDAWLIPVDESSVEKFIGDFLKLNVFCMPKLTADFFYGYLQNVEIELKFYIQDHEIKFSDYLMLSVNIDDLGEFTFSDRASAGRFKNMLIKLFSDKNINYPTEYTNYNFYEMVDYKLGAEEGLSSKYGFSPEMVADFIRSLNVNSMYKDLKL